MASIIGAIKGNNRCSSGIAPNVTIIALKIFKVILIGSTLPVLEPKHWSDSDVISRALSYNLNTTDIFANAWAPVRPFDKLDVAIKDVISHGAIHGRHGLGTVHVVPSGPTGSELSNNIHTITVSSVGRNGIIPDYVYTDASVLTSGLGDGNNLTSSSMVTTTLEDRCVTGFNGISAATAQIAGIIGLGLEANKDLSLRDIQHLLVQSSEHRQLRERIAFTKNAAGRHFHGVFGFGLINADKFVKKAQKHRPTPTMRKKKLKTYITRPHQAHTQTFEFCYECQGLECPTILEYVKVQMDLEAKSTEIKISIVSPGKTTSVLMDFIPEMGKSVYVQKLRLLSCHFWDEDPLGTWLLHVQDKHSASNIQVKHLSLKFYGTTKPAIFKNQQHYRNVCSTNNSTKSETVTTKVSTTKSTEHEKDQTIIKSYFDLIHIVVQLVIIVVALSIMIAIWVDMIVKTIIITRRMCVSLGDDMNSSENLL
ncbi:proprotein convertase subtilisin/kexin type 4-like [Ruditapes philippinarum]|uniref:proprotein convertase subtilisin/kexin type 4-like n=1 Tax=Ruditapes philippinarum TaxID=129788 RepID=UPI00295B1B6D|nr:proprotein convertase subtilisin/kexin type 4-like [Ruditapes philippinarum]